MLNHDKTDVYTQVSTSQILCSGLLETNFTVKDLKNYGDFGFGATAGMQENIMILDGEIISPTDKAIEHHVAICFLSYFISHSELTLEHSMGINELRNEIQSFLISENIVNLVKINGHFDFIQTSSFPKFKKPYPIITEEIVNNSTNKIFYDTSGTLLAFWLPDYCKCINAGAGGLHIHYISDDRNICGHVLDCNITSGKVQLSSKHTISLKLPDCSDFHQLNICENSIDKRIEAWAKEGVGGREGSNTSGFDI